MEKEMFWKQSYSLVRYGRDETGNVSVPCVESSEKKIDQTNTLTLSNGTLEPHERFLKFEIARNVRQRSPTNSDGVMHLITAWAEATQKSALWFNRRCDKSKSDKRCF